MPADKSAGSADHHPLIFKLHPWHLQASVREYLVNASILGFPRKKKNSRAKLKSFREGDGAEVSIRVPEIRFNPLIVSIDLHCVSRLVAVLLQKDDCHLKNIHTLKRSSRRSP